MRIIKTDTNQFIKPEGDTEPQKTEAMSKYFIWGWRWNKNENRFGTQLTGHWFKSFEWVEESELPVDKVKAKY